MSKIDVLDHGFVRLVSYMQPAREAVAERNTTDPEYVLGRRRNFWRRLFGG